MKKLVFISLLLIASVTIWFGCKEDKEYTGSISGIVTDKATGEPIKNAGIELKPSGKNTVTGSDGQFEFVEIELGEYTLVATKVGYNDGESSKITVSAGQTAHCDIQIEKLPPALMVTDDAGNEISEIDFGEETDVRMKPFCIFNNGTSTLEWEISWTAEWIEEISKTSGTLNAGRTQSLNMKIDRSLLQSGMNTTTVSITSNDGSKQLTIKAVNGTLPATLNTLPATNVTTTSAKFNGEITGAGYPSYTERGFVYAESSMPTLENTIHRLTASVNAETHYSAIATGLTLGRTYYVRAYAINTAGTAYSTNQVTIIPNYALPSVTTNAVSGISLSNGTATLNGTIDDMGDPAYTERGFAYGTSHNPSIDTDTKKIVIGTGIGPFQTNITELQLGNTYYVRAYAINNAGISYGNEVTLDFSIVAAAVTTSAPTNKNITDGTATFNGNITNAGDPVYTERGFVYATVHNPNIEDNTKKTVAGSGTGVYSVSIAGLVMGETYYIRAYVINGGVVHYGEEKTLDFSAVLPTVTIQNATQIDLQNKTATLNATIVSVGDPAYEARGFVYGTMTTPTIHDATIATVAGTAITGTYTKTITGLQDVTYYVRAFAQNSDGDVAYSPTTISFSIEPAKLCAGCGPSGSNIWVAINDVAGTLAWGLTNTTTNATSQDNGATNMSIIKAINPSLNSYPAFKACNEMGTGWYLPSKNELNSLYENRNTIGNFYYTDYWSSTEYSSHSAWYQNFEYGASYHGDTNNYPNAPYKEENYRVRCVKRVE